MQGWGAAAQRCGPPPGLRIQPGRRDAGIDTSQHSTTLTASPPREVSYASSDGIDSNGSAYVKGGIVVVSGQAGAMDGSVDANGESQLVGVTGSPSVSAGDTLTVKDSSGSQVASVKVDFTAEAITVLGLTEGQQPGNQSNQNSQSNNQSSTTQSS